MLGSGGFGEVVLARHDASGALVAVKYLLRDVLDDPEFVGMFRAEARVLASLEDPNVVRLYEYVESPSGAAIVMELVDGVSLREILSRQGKTTAEAALVVLQGSLLGLAAAHARGVVHRDYKPENVLIDGAGVSKLTDFGIAARAGDRPIPAGTLAYAPPEQFGGGPASPAGDVYAATATFYECLAGHPPFTASTSEALLYQHLSDPVPLEPVPEPLRPLVTAGMAKNPADRPADAASFVTELRAAAWPAYGQDWEDHGRSHLGEAALLLAALWPSGAAPAVQGQVVEQVRLSQGSQQPREPQHPRNLDHPRHLEHVKHLQHLDREHVEHVEHIEHVGQALVTRSSPGTPAAAEGAGPAGETAGTARAAGSAASATRAIGAAAADAPPSPSPPPVAPRKHGVRNASQAKRFSRRVVIGAAVVIVAAIAAIAVVLTSGSPTPQAGAGSTPNSPGGPAPDVQISVSSAFAPLAGNVFVKYQDGTDASAQISGQVTNVVSGEVAELYAQQFLFTGPPTQVGSVALDPSGTTAQYTFHVTPTLATRYTVKVLPNSTATAPFATSATSKTGSGFPAAAITAAAARPSRTQRSTSASPVT
jgi:serine/threonine-protein kinase